MTETVKLVIAVLIGCALLWGGQTILEWREGSIRSEQRGETIKATGDIMRSGAERGAERVQIDFDVTGAAQAFRDELEEAKRNDPGLRVSSDTPNPASVLEAARKRRLARERSAGAEAER